MTNFLLGGFTVLLVVGVYSSGLSVALVAGDVQGAFMVEDSEDAKVVVVGDWEGEDVAGDAEASVAAGDVERVEGDNLEISCVGIDFGLNMVFVSVLTFSLLLESRSRSFSNFSFFLPILFPLGFLHPLIIP